MNVLHISLLCNLVLGPPYLDVDEEELLVLDAVPGVALLGALVVGVLPVLVQPDHKVQHRPRHLELHVEGQWLSLLKERWA